MSRPARSRRNDILAAAQREFAAAGYSGGRIERIAGSARVNKQLLFHYFDSKEGLFLSAVEAMLSRATPAVTSLRPDHPAEEIRSVIAELEAALAAQPGLLGILADAAANSDFPPAAAGALRRWRDQHLDRLQRAIAEGQARGYFRDDLDPDSVAALGVAAVLGAAALERRAGGLSPSEVLVEYCAWR